MKKIYALLFAFIGIMTAVNAQTTYYSVPSATDPNALASWNSNRDGTSGTTPASFTAGDVFVLQGTGNGAGTPVSMTTTAAWGISGAGSKLQIENGATLTANNAVTLAAASTFQIDNGGTYVHNHAATASANIFAGTESLGVTSTVRISNWTGTGVLSTGVSQTVSFGGNNYFFGNLEINWAGAGAVTWSQGFSSNTFYVANNLSFTALGIAAGAKFRLISSGSVTITIGGTLSIGAIAGTVELSSSTGAGTLNVAAINQAGGIFNFNNSSGAFTVNCPGAFTMSGGTCDISTGSSSIGTLNVAGTFNQSAGTITETGSSAVSIVNFNGTSLQNVTLSGSTTQTVSFGVSNNAGINLAGTMTVGQGGSLIIASNATDPVQGAGTVSYLGALTGTAVMANLKFTALAGTTYTGGAQTITDKIWPITNAPNALFIDNTTAAPNNKVTSALTADRTLIGGASALNQLTITNGIFDIANSSVALGLNANYAISSPNNTKMIVTPGTGFFKLYMPAAGFSNVTFPVGDISGTADYSEMYFLYSTAASAPSFIGVKVKNAIISGDAPGADFAARNWEMTQETVAAGVPSGSAFVSSPAYTMQINGRGPTTDVTGILTNMRFFKNVSGVYTQLNSGSTLSAPNYNSGNAFYTGSFPAISETSVNGYIYAPRTYLGQQIYTWNGNVSTDYQVPGNWTPSRSVTDQGDVLTFDGSVTATATVTNLAAETIGRLIFKNNVQATITGTNGLSTGGGTATGTVDALNIASGSKLVWNSTAALTLSCPTTATTKIASIDGVLETASSGSITISSSNTPTVTLSATGIFNYGSAATAGITNSGGAAFLLLNSGATINHLRAGGGTILPTGTFNTGSNVNVGTVGTPATSISFFPPTTFNSNLTMYYNSASSGVISVGAPTIFGGTWSINTSGSARVRFSGSSTNTWTFTKQVTVTSTNTASGIDLSTGTSSVAAPVYNFSAPTAPSLSITGGALAQQAAAAVTFTTVNIANGLTFGAAGSIIANASGAAQTSGDFTINMNGGDLTFGTGCSMAGALNTANATSKTLISFLAAAGDQNFTPPSTFTGANNLTVNKVAGNVNILTRGLTVNTFTLASGKLILGANNLTVTKFNTSGTSGLMGGSATNWVVTNGTGTITYTNLLTAGRNFPIGATTTTYDPFTALPAATATFTVNVKDASGGYTTAPRDASLAQSPNREWTVTSSGSGTIEFGNTVATRVGKLQAGAWTEFAAIGSGFNGLTGYAYTAAESGSKFGIGSLYAFAPVSLTSAATGNFATASTWTPAVSPLPVDAVTIISGHNVSLGTSATINNVTLTNGLITLGSNDLTVNNIITGTFSPANHIVTDGSGALTIKNVPTGGRIFPVGISASSYDPVAIKPLAVADFAVKVKNTFSNPVYNPAKVCNREWDIVSASTGANVEFEPGATATCPATGTKQVGHYTGGTWVETASVPGVNFGFSYSADFTSFSPFAVGVAGGFLSTTGNSVSGINKTFAVLDLGAGNAFYDLFATTGNPDLEGANLGNFSACTGTLNLKGAENQVYKCAGGDITGTKIYYRVYKVGDTPGAFANLAIGFSSGFANGCGGQDQTWANVTYNVNLLAGITTTGTYTLEVYSTADYNNGTPGVWTADNTGANYKATFVVTTVPATANAGGNQTICGGNTFTVSGATATNNSGVNWTTSGDGTFINGTTLTATYTPGVADILLGTATLTLTATGNAPCSNATSNMTLTITTTGFLAGTPGGPQVCQTKVIGIGATFNDNSCNTIASVVPAGASPVSGSITGCVKVESSIPVYAAKYYVARHYDIEPAVAPATSSANVTLYFSPAEMAAFNADLAAAATHYPLPVLPTDNTDSVRIEQYHGTGTNPSNYTGALETWSTANGLTVIFSNGYWAITVPATSFSGFWLSAKPKPPLPVTVEYFRGAKSGSSHNLTWKVSCTNTPYATMTLERSADGRNFGGIYTITASAVRCLQAFDYADVRPITGINFYRLKMADADGKVTYSTIVALTTATKGFEVINITPNPVTEGKFKLNITSAEKMKMEVVITDIAGRVVAKQSNTLIAGFNAIDVNVNSLANGTYQLTGITAEGRTKTMQFVKQ